jgi:hypothetical protein
MNQFTPKSLFEAPSAMPIGQIPAGTAPLSLSLRQLAARFKMHHAIIHRLGHASLRLSDATYSSTIRGYGTSSWTLGDLLTPSTIEMLLAGNSAVSWHNQTLSAPPANDPLSRADIRHGISVPFHNALGNHVALTLCDSALTKICTAELHQSALPLIDGVLAAARNNKAAPVLNIPALLNPSQIFDATPFCRAPSKVQM